MIPPVRSYVADGRVVHWWPRGGLPDGWRYAVDAEIAAQAVPEALGARTGIADAEAFWPRWTAAEVCSKLLDVPIVMWLARHGLTAQPAEHGVTLRTFRHEDLVVSIGALCLGRRNPPPFS